MSDVIADLLLAITHARAGRQAKAEQLLQSVLADDPDNAHALFLLGQGALADGRAGEAAQHLARALAGRPAHRDSRLMLARAQLAIGKAAEALATLDPLESDKDLAGAQTLRGTALGALGRPLEAITAFSHAIEVNPGDAEAHLNLGNAHAELDERRPPNGISAGPLHNCLRCWKRTSASATCSRARAGWQRRWLPARPPSRWTRTAR